MDDANDRWPELLATGSDGDAADELFAALCPIFQTDGVKSEANGARGVEGCRAGTTSRDAYASITVVANPNSMQRGNLAIARADERLRAGSTEKLERQRELSAKRKRAHRERVKLEMEELNAQVAALERELRALEGSRVSSGPDSSQRKRSEVWRELATRHQERRRAAERLNEQLKRKIARNGALLGDLARVPTAHCWEHNQSLATQCCSPRGDFFDSSLLIGFAQELDAIYARTDEVMLRRGRFPSEPEDLWSHSVTRHCDRATQSELFEIVDSFVLPFAYSKASPALWLSMAQIYATDPGLLETEAIEHPARTIAVHYRIYGNPRDASCMSCSFVFRQYIERDRTVLVWRALSEGQEGSMAGVATDETGWSVLHSMPSGCCFSMDGEGGTVMNTFVRMTPLVSDVAKGRGRALDLESFVSKVISSVSEDGDAISRLMDGLLLTEV